MRKSRRRTARIARQRGVALLLVLLLMIIGVGIFVVGASQETMRVVRSERNVAAALNEAKEALIGYAVARETRPGALPCPDRDDNGEADALVAGECPSYLGRLPWRTLGLGDLRDENGERFWYALSENFRDFGAINSDRKGNRIVHSGSATATQTTEAVAVIFAPGALLAPQIRNSTPTACATTGTTIAANLCAANYLEMAQGVNNAAFQGRGPFIAAQPSASFNDRLIVLRTSELIPLVERRVAADLRRVLFEYRETSRRAVTGGGCNCYPWPDSNNNGASNVGNNRGRIPVAALPHNWSTPAMPSTVKDGAGKVYTLPQLPSYFVANNWHTVIYYAVGRSALQNFGLAPTLCTTCTNDPLLSPPPTQLERTLSIDKNIGHAVVLITPGSAGANRPGAVFNWGNYIDDAANRDDDDRFVTPASKALDRDRLYTIPEDLPPQSCNTNARTLIFHAPCHTTGTEVKPVCQRARENLTFCGCSDEGQIMLEEPCRNSLNPPECQAAAASLRACKGL